MTRTIGKEIDMGETNSSAEAAATQELGHPVQTVLLELLTAPLSLAEALGKDL